MSDDSCIDCGLYPIADEVGLCQPCLDSNAALLPNASDKPREKAPSARENAAHWCRIYADELEAGGWTEDAAHFRREARLLDA